MLKRMSYPLFSRSPLYSGIPPATFQDIKSMAKRDRAKTTYISISSHFGTHIDVPEQFYSSGKTVRGMLRERLDLLPVYCIDIQVKPDSAIGISESELLVSCFQNVGGLFVRTGMYRTHATDPDTFCTGYPWVRPDLPQSLRAVCLSLRLFDLDTISISNPLHRTGDRDCHRAFLCGENPIVFAEDLDLSDPSLTTRPMVMMIYLWIADDLDGVPALFVVEFLSQSDDFLKEIE
jgi:arylformamidase